MPCEFCTDPDGIACMPSYGLAPHQHVCTGGTIVFGATEFVSEKEHPDYFVPDSECPEMGTWFCPYCREGL